MYYTCVEKTKALISFADLRLCFRWFSHVATHFYESSVMKCLGLNVSNFSLFVFIHYDILGTTYYGSLVVLKTWGLYNGI